jgi:uncharacterized protein (TIGR03067 family)
MKSPSVLLSGVALLFIFSAAFSADDTKEEAIKKDRKRYEGTWQAVSVELNGSAVAETDIKGLTVVNEADGKWTIKDGDRLTMEGTSEIDPTKKPRTIDLTYIGVDGKKQTMLGIYQFDDENNRKVCLAEPGKARPTEFSSTEKNGHTLAVFKRVKK